MAISVADNFSYNGAKPLDARVKYATVSAMVLVPDANLYNGIIAYVEENKRYYAYDSNNTVDPTTGKWRIFESGVVQNYAILDNKPSINNVILSGNKNSDVLGLQDAIQMAEMPTAGIDYAGKIFQYTGVTSNSYDHGYFYECVENGGVYSWENVNVQDGGGSGGGGGHTIQDNGTDKTNRSNLNFVDFDIADDSTNDATNVEVHRITSAELAEIFSSGLPGAISAVDYGGVTNDANIFSTDEKVIGQWKDGKPLYQKTLVGNAASTANSLLIFDVANAYIVGIPFCTIDWDGNGDKWFSPYPGRLDFYSDSSNSKLYLNNQPGGGSETRQFGKPYVVVVRYTKTTDSAVSSGEKIVGQWVDGKPIYQKTLIGTCSIASSDSASPTVVNISDCNIDTFIDMHGYYNNYDPPLNGAQKWSSNQMYTVFTRYNESGSYISVHNVWGTTITSYNITIRYTKV